MATWVYFTEQNGIILQSFLGNYGNLLHCNAWQNLTPTQSAAMLVIVN